MSRGRWPVVILLVVSLLTADLTRRWAAAQRSSGKGGVNYSTAGLSRMNSYALALMLGGLRGPLVMFLWPSAERQKSERNLEDFDTKIEWIRLLQAEFDTVHIFQIWNKAYNISAQLANVGNKYSAILDALDYARSVDAERPNNINIMYDIARVYGDKLGRSAERAYYRQRVRDETQARQPVVRVVMPKSRRGEFAELAWLAGFPPPRLRFSVDESSDVASVTVPKFVASVIQPRFMGEDVTFTDRMPARSSSADPRFRRRELDPLLDPDGNLLPQYYAGKIPRPRDLPANSEWNDGSDLQYLKQFEPYPYGVSTLALGYNYYKRAQVLLEVNKQKHAQLTNTVIGSRPAVGLRDWSEEEWERGRRAEIEGLGLKVPLERQKMESITAQTPLDATVLYPPLMNESIYSYERSARLIDASVQEYRRHLEKDKTNLQLYTDTMNEIRARRELVLGDADYLKAMLLPPDSRGPLRTEANTHYHQAVRQFRIVLLKSIPDEVASKAYGPNLTKANIYDVTLNDEELEKRIDQAMSELTGDIRYSDSMKDLMEYLDYISRAQVRLNNLGAPLRAD